MVVGVQLDGARGGRRRQSALTSSPRSCSSAGGEVVGRVVQRRAEPDPATFIGKGKVARGHRGGEIEPRPTRSCSTTSSRRRSCATSRRRSRGKVIDRTILILDIFAQRATSIEGRSRSSSRSSRTGCRDCVAGVKRCRASVVPPAAAGAAAVGAAPRSERVVPVRRSSRSTGGGSSGGSRSSRASSKCSANAARARGSSARNGPDGFARRLHERRQVDAAEPPHRGRRRSSKTGCSRRSIPRRDGCVSRAASPSS